MTGPDLSHVEVEWGGKKLRLKFTNGALYALQSVLNAPKELHTLPSTGRKLSTETLAVFVWAALLHLDPPGSGRSPESVDSVRTWVDWSDSPIHPLYGAVGEAFQRGIFGSLPEEEKRQVPKASRVKRLMTSLGNMFSRSSSPRISL